MIQYNEMARRNERKLNQEIRHIKETTPCARCDQKFPYYCVDFDHLDESQKVCDINKLMWRASRERVMQEIAKCQVLCKLCHAIVTHERQEQRLCVV